jgi:hypothetical protein
LYFIFLAKIQAATSWRYITSIPSVLVGCTSFCPSPGGSLESSFFKEDFPFFGSASFLLGAPTVTELYIQYCSSFQVAMLQCNIGITF